MGSLWGVAYILHKYPICEQLSTGKTLKKPKQNKKTTEKLNHQDVVMLLQCFGPGALLVWVVLLGGLGWDARGRGSYWSVSSFRRPLCSR